jgi:hypothetical protein
MEEQPIMMRYLSDELLDQVAGGKGKPKMHDDRDATRRPTAHTGSVTSKPPEDDRFPTTV